MSGASPLDRPEVPYERGQRVRLVDHAGTGNCEPRDHIGEWVVRVTARDADGIFYGLNRPVPYDTADTIMIDHHDVVPL